MNYMTRTGAALTASLLLMASSPAQASTPQAPLRDSATTDRYGEPDTVPLQFVQYDAPVPALRLQNRGARMAMVVEVGIAAPSGGRCGTEYPVTYLYEAKLKTGETSHFRVPDGPRLADQQSHLCVRAIARRTRVATWSDVSFATVYAPLSRPALARLNKDLGTRYGQADSNAAPAGR
jgi:hypothetical protein